MSVLVDTSIWIEYFRSGNDSEKLDFLIDENLIVINDLILAELVPYLRVRNQRKIVKLLYNINKLELSINWDQIIEFQFKCLKNGLNGIGNGGRAMPTI
jgi:predicted nucleic acid-binding protein